MSIDVAEHLRYYSRDCQNSTHGMIAFRLSEEIKLKERTNCNAVNEAQQRHNEGPSCNDKFKVKVPSEQLVRRLGHWVESRMQHSHACDRRQYHCCEREREGCQHQRIVKPCKEELGLAVFSSLAELCFGEQKKSSQGRSHHQLEDTEEKTSEFLVNHAAFYGRPSN